MDQEFTTSGMPMLPRLLALGESLTMIGKLLGHSDIEIDGVAMPIIRDRTRCASTTAERIADSRLKRMSP